MQLLFAMGFEHAMAPSDDKAGEQQRREWGDTDFAGARPTLRIGLQDDTYFVSSAKILNYILPNIQKCIEDAAHAFRPTQVCGLGTGL